jgi:RNA polymerase sigma-70 factor (ECF subfamily)
MLRPHDTRRAGPGRCYAARIVDEHERSPMPGSDSAGDVTALLHRIQLGEREAADRLLPLVWESLRARAVRLLSGVPAAAQLQPTAVVDEAFVRLLHQRAADWRNRAQFLALAATAMRRIVSDQARHWARARRDGRRDVALPDDLADGTLSFERIGELDELLDRLAALHARSAKVVELRFFVGLPMAEIAAALRVSLRTIEGDWHFARAWLRARLNA